MNGWNLLKAKIGLYRGLIMYIKYKDILYDLLEEQTYLSIITRNELNFNENFLNETVIL